MRYAGMVALGMAVILPVHPAGVRTGPTPPGMGWHASGYPEGLARRPREAA
jgi:hypothetical protein